jgi:hypothetical protein
MVAGFYPEQCPSDSAELIPSINYERQAPQHQFSHIHWLIDEPVDRKTC